MRTLEVLCESPERWVVRFAGEASALVSEHASRAEAEAAARAHGLDLGAPIVKVREPGGATQTIVLEPHEY
jgi:hypothetical protein